MSKFEIINNKWIRVKTRQGIEAIRIDSIICVKMEQVNEDHYKYILVLTEGASVHIILHYSSNEKDEFSSDCKSIEALLF